MKRIKGLLAIVIVLIGSVGIYTLMTRNKVVLKSNVFTFEYGDEIIFEKKEIINTTDSKMIDRLVIDESNIVMEENKNYPKVGQYNVSVNYTGVMGTQSEDFTVVVADTTKPTFVQSPETIKVNASNDEFDFEASFEVEDLSEFELTIDTSLVNFEKTGEYSAQAIATDLYGNEAIHDFSVLVETDEDEFEATQTDELAETKPDVSEEIVQTPDPSKITPTIKKGILIVNKKHPLPADYSPGEDPTAVAQLKKLISEMQRLGYDIGNSYSGFRTYDYQKNLYNRYVNEDGKKAADTYSARPGHSEHQTGLTFDLTHRDGSLVKKEAEAKWIAENAANYGFIVRYQVGKESITGYKSEPWHLRYIGNQAKAIHQSGLTLEEYLGVEGGDYYDD